MNVAFDLFQLSNGHASAKVDSMHIKMTTLAMPTKLVCVLHVPSLLPRREYSTESILWAVQRSAQAELVNVCMGMVHSAHLEIRRIRRL